MGRFEPFADNVIVSGSWHIPKLLPAASHRRLRKIQRRSHQPRRLRRPRPGARRDCPPRRRRIAAAGPGRMPDARRSAMGARSAATRRTTYSLPTQVQILIPCPLAKVRFFSLMGGMSGKKALAKPWADYDKIGDAGMSCSTPPSPQVPS